MKYSKYTISVDAKSNSDGPENLVRKLSVSDKKGTDGNIIVGISNNSAKEATKVELAVLFYKNNKIVGVTIGQATSIKTAASSSVQFLKPFGISYTGMN